MRAQISPNGNPNAFYTQLVTAPYAGNAIISTHVYGPSVTHATTNFSGAGLDWRLSVSFGKKTLYVRLTPCVSTVYASCCIDDLHHLSARQTGFSDSVQAFAWPAKQFFSHFYTLSWPQGYTTPSGQTRKFPAILGEFGSYMNNSQDSCFNDNCIAGEGAVRH